MKNPRIQQQLRMGLGVVIWIVMIVLSQESIATVTDHPAGAVASHSRALVG